MSPKYLISTFLFELCSTFKKYCVNLDNLMAAILILNGNDQRATSRWPTEAQTYTDLEAKMS